MIIYHQANPVTSKQELASLPALPPVQATDRLLVIVPHPDDETLGAAGLLVLAHNSGAQARVVVVTDANKHGRGQRRRAESRQALALLQGSEADIQFWGYPEGALHNDQSLRAAVARLLAEYRPTIAVTTVPADLHRDHRALGLAVTETAAATHYAGRLYGFLVHYRRYPLPRRYSPASPLLLPRRLEHRARWYRLMLSPQTESLKFRAVSQYRTQLSMRNPILRELLYGLVRPNELYCDLTAGGAPS